ncbi:NAD(P)-dependent oxidoreductase [Microbispora sp. GKU 823]|uniref:NAD-dependent epimerase/dehydratase family protein n=1 Tax=Microbispora sp. GKU 823 TaxID=1652100 RepID=UPI0009A33B0C|nr:NAD-dependent epimerase/dehydratase family protein [Microbispora sp. GKU 823]OPG12427.1 nucleoside-diphosphate sugar epimerase [Microbispora sp. GKU 823]
MTNAPRRTYLITGGSGFVGSHLTDALLARGDSVVVLDDLSTGRLANLTPHPNLRFVQGSVLDTLMVDELVRQCDVVVHLAAAVGVKLILKEPLRSFVTNIRGTETVIEAAHRYRRKILVTSTSEIYGKNAGDALTESADRILGSPALAKWSYSTAKAVDEILANTYHKERGLPTIVVRLFNTVGPRQSPAYGMVIPALVRQAVTGQPLTVYGDGTQTRCFAHVKDVVDGLVRLLDHEGAVGRTFNIGASHEVSILELAKLVIEMTKSTSGVELVPYSEAYGEGFEDMTRRVPDTTRLRELTGWSPRRTLDDILTETIAEARAELAAPLR